ncbi:hypothetical protein Psal006b_00511 [Piscirickettsia salmonis]|uniref:Uncharacterized protein n=1 Tax=Piscirickettsia salmonis TaxID=1238 RepID=A0AAC8VJZ2_PISSA|nr:hypothetical protein KU39_2671 [Piscirickettsia salmonis]QGN97556.1 hypothetical protein Psal006b_00511 [Piscirickettsia salmonis]QGO01159.1 hypothetical protein Psal008_00519 [Piscirickettsia salmonis]QGO11874.1 hypothetical protein Psal010b_00510 [Piscirickettsia salmonis]QGO18901.1 hypothetical protein Psal013_00515 [Piscirickettsia salmonis]
MNTETVMLFLYLPLFLPGLNVESKNFLFKNKVAINHIILLLQLTTEIKPLNINYHTA